jgi:hypothetical protein
MGGSGTGARARAGLSSRWRDTVGATGRLLDPETSGKDDGKDARTADLTTGPGGLGAVGQVELGDEA